MEKDSKIHSVSSDNLFWSAIILYPTGVFKVEVMLYKLDGLSYLFSGRFGRRAPVWFKTTFLKVSTVSLDSRLHLHWIIGFSAESCSDLCRIFFLEGKRRSPLVKGFLQPSFYFNGHLQHLQMCRRCLSFEIFVFRRFVTFRAPEFTGS